MVRAQADDDVAFAELYGRHAEFALLVAGDICRDRDRTEEAVQDGFLSIWRSRADYRPRLGSFGAWSMRIVRNRAIDSVRVVGARTLLPAEPPEVDSAEEEDSDPLLSRAIAASERAQLLVALSRLPRLQAQVIVLSYYGDLSQSEIAIRLGIPAGTVKGRMRLGLEKLRFTYLPD